MEWTLHARLLAASCFLFVLFVVAMLAFLREHFWRRELQEDVADYKTGAESFSRQLKSMTDQRNEAVERLEKAKRVMFEIHHDEAIKP